MSLIFTGEPKKAYSCFFIKSDALPKRTLYIFIFLQVLWLASFGQTKIFGVVKNEKGELLSGVSVNFKQTSIGSTTDQNGKYGLNFRSKGVLVFTSIGYLKQEINVNGQTSINVVLVSQANSLNEVTVVGYGTQKKTSLTSAVADIKGEDLNKRSVADATQALQGLAPGVTVIDQGGGPGRSQVSIRVRGITTLSGNDPLVMVDGIEQSLNDINPSDIESRFGCTSAKCRECRK